MFLSVRTLELRKLLFETAFAPGQLEFADARLRLAGPLTARGMAELLASVDEIRVRGHLSGAIDYDCDRCLEAATFPIDGDFDLFYRPSKLEPEASEVAVGEDESEIGFFEGEGLELADVVREQILLWLPMQRLCQPACKGICPVCGQNRNQTECSCRPRVPDDRWAALRQIQ